MRLQRSIARVNPSTTDKGSSVLSDMDGRTGIYSTIACAAMYNPGETPENMKDGRIPSRGPAHRERSVCAALTSPTEKVSITYDSLSSKYNRQQGTCVSHEGPLICKCESILSSASQVFGMQIFPHLSQSDAKPEHGYQIKGADLGTEPGKWCNWFNSILIQRYEWLERHGGTGTVERGRENPKA